MEIKTKNPEKIIKEGIKKKHKHWFQFVEKFNEYKTTESPNPTGKVFAEFVCFCGEQRIVEIKKAEKPEEK